MTLVGGIRTQLFLIAFSKVGIFGIDGGELGSIYCIFAKITIRGGLYKT